MNATPVMVRIVRPAKAPHNIRRIAGDIPSQVALCKSKACYCVSLSFAKSCRSHWNGACSRRVRHAGSAEKVSPDARLRRDAGAVRRQVEAHEAADFRHSEASGFASSLRLPTGDGGRAEVVGGTERSFV